MSKLAVYLLGPPFVERDSAGLALKRRKVMALLAYLAVTAQRHSREVLTDLLYPEKNASLARSDFRQTLSILQGALGSGWLEVDRATVMMPPRPGLWIDVKAFRASRAEGQGAAGSETAPNGEESLAAAIRLYRGEFLSGFALPGCPGFDDWMLFEAESLRREYALVLQKLADIHESRGAFDTAIDFARRRLSLDSLDEEVHRSLMRLYDRAGRREAAIRQYHACALVLERELGETPDEETRKLYADIRSNHEPETQTQRVRRSAGQRIRPPILEVPRRKGLAPPEAQTAVMTLLLADSSPAEVATSGQGLLGQAWTPASRLAEACRALGGRTLRTPRARFLAAFKEPAAAISAALRAAACPRATGSSCPDSPPASPSSRCLRISIAAGTIVVHDDGCAGPAVDSAAALLDVAHAGQVLLTVGAANLLNGVLPDATGLRSLGVHRLKDLGPARQVFQLLHAYLASEFPPLRTLDCRPNNLPGQLTALVGRERELAELVGQLALGDTRLVTLTGPGGTGKTRLALHAAAAAIDSYEAGAFFVDLSRLRSPGGVVAAILEALGVREAVAGVRPLLRVLEDHLQSRHMLLVLDNFEHLLPAAMHVRALLSECPRLGVLATSREPLHISGERVFTVQPLRLAPPEASPEWQLSSEALRLFAERGTGARPGFTVTRENAAVVAEICRRVDGLPLAIELAASRLRVLSADELLHHLADQLEVLSDDSPGRPARQRTLRSTLDWSHSLLRREEQELFARLWVFVGGCTLEAALQVCSVSGPTARHRILDGLASLVDKSLLVREEAGGQSRLVMLEAIREYAKERFELRGEVGRLRERHARFYLHFAGEARLRLHGPDQMTWRDRVERERGNFRVALAWFLETGRARDGLRLASALEWFWLRSGQCSEGRDWLTAAIGVPGAPRDARADALRALGHFAFQQGDWPHACAYLEESRDLSRQLGRRAEESLALAVQSVVERTEGRESAADEHAEQAVRIAREAADPWGLALVLIAAYATRGGVFAGRIPAAELEEAVRLFRQAGDLWGIAHALDGLGDIYRELGQLTRARSLYEESLERFRELRDPWMTAWVLEGLASVAIRDGDLSNAETWFSESIALFHSTGDTGNTVLLIGKLGLLARARGDHMRASCLLGAFAALFESSTGWKAAGRLDKSPELAVAMAEYNAGRAKEWADGQALSLEQAVSEAERSGAA